MKQHLKMVVGLSLAGSVIAQTTLPAMAAEIDWKEVPGTLEDYGDFDRTVWLIGTNTIARNGDSINFDLMEDMHFSYMRVAGNCRTGWMNIIASGYYGSEGEIVVEYRNNRPFDVQHNKPRLSLQFACSQSR
jgi:hypothetical protein